MSTINIYNRDQWNAMKMLKSSLAYMKPNNGEGRFDAAIPKQRAALKHLMTGAPFRKELPDEEEPAAACAA